MKKIVSISALALCIITGCKLSSETVPPPALARFIHASPDAGNIDVLLNGALLAQNFAFTKDTAVAVYPGITSFLISKTGSSTSLINTNFSLSPEKAYSIFAIDNVSSIKATVTEDNFVLPPSDSVKVRFFHLSPNAGAIDAAFTNTTDTLKSLNRSFNDQESSSSKQAFVQFKAGTYKLDVFPTGTSVSLVTVPSVSLTGGNVYTLFLKGNNGGTGEQALGLATVLYNK